MRKSKRKHLLKHQSYPFWPGPVGGVVGPKGTGTLGWAPRGCTFPQPWARALPESCCQPAVLSLCARRHHHAQAWGEGHIPRPPSSWRLRIVLQLLYFLPGVNDILGENMVVPLKSANLS